MGCEGRTRTRSGPASVGAVGEAHLCAPERGLKSKASYYAQTTYRGRRVVVPVSAAGEVWSEQQEHPVVPLQGGGGGGNCEEGPWKA